jgi:hypothetical protein
VENRWRKARWGDIEKQPERNSEGAVSGKQIREGGGPICDKDRRSGEVGHRRWILEWVLMKDKCQVVR